jgi:DNA-binding beta-propeller fold protein YncE
MAPSVTMASARGRSIGPSVGWLNGVVRDEGPELQEINAPLRLQPVVGQPRGWRGRSGSLVAVALVGFVVVAVALGTMADDGRPAAPVAVASGSPSSTTRVTARPTRSRQPLATPLPSRQVLGGRIPEERRLVIANGFELLDLATGTLAQPSGFLDFPLAVLPNDELVCACTIRDVAASGDNSGSALVFRRFDPTGVLLVEREIQSFAGAVAVPEMTEGFATAMGVDPDGHKAFVLVTERKPPVWTTVLHVVDVQTGKVDRTIDLGTVPTDLEGPTSTASPIPGQARDGVYLWPNWVSVAPGGRTGYLWLSRSEVRNDNWTDQPLEWMVTDGTLATRLEAGSVVPSGSWCQGAPVFLDAELMAGLCFPPGGNQGSMVVRRLRSDGSALPDIPVDTVGLDGGWPLSVIVDRAHRAMYVWHVQRHVLARIDLDSAVVRVSQVSQEMLPTPGPSGVSQRWYGTDSGLAISPDGDRLYAIGMSTRAGDYSGGVPSGVWVFDATGVELLDQWEPRAYLTSIAVSRDGQFVYAAGAPGIDVNGRDNPWSASVTVYDAETGEIQIIYGKVSVESYGYSGLTFYHQP